MKYPIVLYPAVEGGYVAEIPLLKGCLAQGENVEECLDELETIAALWLESATRNAVPIPPPELVSQRLHLLTAA
jgi:antitoxin HicB